MQDLQVINQRNAEAIERNIPDLLAKGHFVVIEKSGLHTMGCENFSGDGAEDRANAKLAELTAQGGSTHGELLRPTHATVEA